MADNSDKIKNYNVDPKRALHEEFEEMNDKTGSLAEKLGQKKKTSDYAEKVDKYNLDPDLALYEEVQEINDNLSGIDEAIAQKVVPVKGDKGEKGDKGDKGENGKDGKNGRDGKDGRNGVDGKDGIDGIDGRDGKDGKDGRDGKDGSPDTPEQVRGKLEVSFTKNPLDVKYIKNFEKYLSRVVQEQPEELKQAFGPSGMWYGSANPFSVFSDGVEKGSNITGINFSGFSSVTNNNGYITVTAGGGVSFGTDNQIPYTNAAGTDFDYSANFTYDGTTLNVDSSNITINEAGADIDFRIESDTKTHAFFLQGSDGYLGINQSSPASPLDLVGNNAEGRIMTFNSVGTEYGHIDQTTAGGLRWSSNITWTGSGNNWNLDDTADAGVTLLTNSHAGASAIFAMQYASAGANPRTNSNLWLMTSNGWTSYGNPASTPTAPFQIYYSGTSTTPILSAIQSSTGDAGIYWSISGDSYQMGIDNSDSDLFKLSYASSNAVLGTNDIFVINGGTKLVSFAGGVYVNGNFQLPTSGSVISWNSGDVTITHSSNTLTFSGASTGYLFDSIVAPSINDGSVLGSASLQWSDLYLAEGGVINWDNGDATITQSGNQITTAGADFAVGSSSRFNVSDTTGALTMSVAGTPLTVSASPSASTGFFAVMNFALDTGSMTGDSGWNAIFLNRTGSDTSTGSANYIRLQDSSTDFFQLDRIGEITWKPLGLSGFSSFQYNGTNTNNNYGFFRASNAQTGIVLRNALVTDDGSGIGFRFAVTTNSAYTPVTNTAAKVLIVGNGMPGSGSATDNWYVTAAGNQFMASATKIDWNAGDVTLTHSSNLLTLAGGTLVLPASGLQIGSSNPFSDSSGTLTLQNVDVVDSTTATAIRTAIKARESFTAGNGSTATTSGYLKAGHNGQTMTAARGWVMPRSGSIVGISIAGTCTISSAGSTVTYEAYINGASVFTTSAISTASTGDYTDYATQASGIDTFSAGDVLSMFETMSGAVATVDDRYMIVEVEFDS